MRVAGLNNNNNFGANVKLSAQYKDMANLGPLKSLSKELQTSGTNNVYEFGKSTFTNPQRTSGKHELLLNGEKFDELVQTPQQGAFGLLQNFLKKCVEKENSLQPVQNPEVAKKLEKIREAIKEAGLDIENVKKWL